MKYDRFIKAKDDQEKRWCSLFIPVKWSKSNAFVSGAGGLKFKSRVGQLATVRQ